MTDILNALVHLTNLMILPGLAYASQLALGAMGVTLIFSVLRFSNFAHAETMSLGTAFCIIVTLWFQQMGIGLGFLPTALLALPIAIVLTAIVLILSDRMVYRHFRRNNAKPEIFMILSSGIMLIINGMTRLLVGPEGRNIDDGERFLLTGREFKEWSGLAEALVIKNTVVLTIVIAVFICSVLFWFLKNTETGKSMRAYSDNRDLALLSGVDPERIVFITWILVAILATLGGVLFGLDKGYRPFVFQQFLLPVFAAAVVGGLGSQVGAIVGAVVIAFSEIGLTFAWKRFFTYLLPENLEPTSLMQILSTEYKFAVSFTILVLVLLFKPNGLMGGSKR